MVSKLIGLSLLGMIHASADPDEATNLDKVMTKFSVPAAMRARPGVRGGAPLPVDTVQSGDIMGSDVFKILANLEEQNQETQLVYQRLRARIEKMPQADDRASFGSAAPFGWLAGVFAFVGMAASVGVAAARKYSGHGQQGQESTSDAQISLVPQRAGLIMASAADGPARGGAPLMAAKQKFAYGLPGNFNAIGGSELNFDPAGFLEGKSELEVNRYREAEITHGRVSMLASLGFLVQEKFHPLFSGDGGPAIDQLPMLPIWLWGVMLAGIGSAEQTRIAKGWQKLNPETSTASQALRAGYKPGDLGFDPLGLAPEDPAEFREMQEKELAHARLAMIAAAGFLAQEAVTKQTWGTALGLPDF